MDEREKLLQASEDAYRDLYREKIAELVWQSENLDYLEFIYNMMIAFKEKWGI